MAHAGSLARSLRLPRAGAALSVALLALAFAPAAGAQSTTDKAAAETLFQEARDLMGARKFADACRKLEASYKLDPAVGTALNLGDCFEQDKRSASAWGAFREAEDLARRSGDVAREAEARRRSSALESKLVRLRIDVPKQSRVQGLVVRRDGFVVDPAMFASQVPVDPGKHVVEATAPGRRRWHLEVSVSEGGESGEVIVPVLRPLVDEAPLELPPTPSAAPAPEEQKGLGAQRWAALGAGALGVVGFGTATVFWMKSRSTWSDAVDRCPAFQCSNPNDVTLESQARDQAGIATVTALAGLGAVTAGMVLWVTAPSRTTVKRETPAPTVAISPWGSGISVRGTY